MNSMALKSRMPTTVALVKRVLVMLVTLVTISGCGVEQLPLADGTQTRIDDWQGRWVVINYWAEWCAPCREEIPELNRLYAEAGAAGPLVIGVNYDNLKAADLQPLIQRMQIGFPVLQNDPMQRFGYERPEILPTTVLLKPDLSVGKVLRGPQSAESIRKVIESL